MPDCSCLCYLGGGSEWSEEAITRFEQLAHVAQWKPLQAKTTNYLQDELGAMPCLQMIDTNESQVKTRKKNKKKCISLFTIGFFRFDFDSPSTIFMYVFW